MFTVGIFTTHIPYIAFVVFYAFFLIFGADKAASGEIQLGEESIMVASHHSKIYTETGHDNFYNFHYQSGPFQFPPGVNEVFIFKRKLKQGTQLLLKDWHCSISPVLFSRPPPAVS